MSGLSRILLLGGLLLLGACDEWHLSINSDGLVFISIVDDRHELRERFRVRIRDASGTTRMLAVPSSGELSLSATADGALQLTLETPQGCLIAGPNPRMLTVSAGEEIRVAFEVHCA